MHDIPQRRGSYVVTDPSGVRMVHTPGSTMPGNLVGGGATGLPDHPPGITSSPKPSSRDRMAGQDPVLMAAVDFLQRAGREVPPLIGGHELVMLAMTHSGSDFPKWLVDAMGRATRTRYEAVPPVLRSIGRYISAQNFKEVHMPLLGEAPQLKPLLETGEISYATTDEETAKLKLGTFATIVSFSRQMIENDPGQGFLGIANGFGTSQANLEGMTFLNLLRSNSGAGPTMDDGHPLFDAANHNNLGSTTGAQGNLTLENLKAARTKMRKQKGLDGTSPINVTAHHLIVPAALETDAEALLADLYPQKAEDVNSAAKGLTLHVEPRLDAFSETDWYLATGPERADSILYADLRGQGVDIDIEPSFERDGLAIRALYDFGVTIADWRGLYRHTYSAT